MFQGPKSEKSMFQGSKISAPPALRCAELDPRTAHTMLAAETLLAYSAEQEGGLIVHRGFIKTALAKACGLFGSLWEKVANDLEPGAFAKCGSITNVAVVATMPEATHLVGFSIKAENSVLAAEAREPAGSPRRRATRGGSGAPLRHLPVQVRLPAAADAPRRVPRDEAASPPSA